MVSNEHEPARKRGGVVPGRGPVPDSPPPPRRSALDPPEGYELRCENCGAPIHRAGNWALSDRVFGTARYAHDRPRTTTSDTDCGMTATPRRIALTGAVATDDHLGTLRAPAPSDGPAAPLEPGQPHVDVLERRQRTTGADQLHLFEQRPGILHNLVAHPMLVLWPRLGEWLHAHTSATRP